MTRHTSQSRSDRSDVVARRELRAELWSLL
jgi:hypothetical protein